MSTPPKEIYLQWRAWELGEVDWAEITWEVEQVFPTDTAYVRADIHDTLANQLHGEIELLKLQLAAEQLKNIPHKLFWVDKSDDLD